MSLNRSSLGATTSVLLLAVFLVFGLDALAVEHDPGLLERLDYDLFFGPLPVGEASISAYRMSLPEGDYSHLVLKADSYPLVDAVFKVRDRAQSVLDPGAGRSLWYIKSVIDDGYWKSKETRFHWKTSTSRQIVNAETASRVSLPPGTFDPLSVLYTLREMYIRGFGVQKAWITDGKSVGEALFQVLKREKVRVPAGDYDAYVVSVEMFGVEPPMRTGEDHSFKVWIAPDQGNLPVKVLTSIDLGPFHGILNAVLVRVERHRNELTGP